MKISHIDLGEHPIFLAPMEDVTDPAFRLMCKKFGADMVYTEFVSSDALILLHEFFRSIKPRRSSRFAMKNAPLPYRYTVKTPKPW